MCEHAGADGMGTRDCAFAVPLLRVNIATVLRIKAIQAPPLPGEPLLFFGTPFFFSNSNYKKPSGTCGDQRGRTDRALG